MAFNEELQSLDKFGSFAYGYVDGQGVSRRAKVTSRFGLKIFSRSGHLPLFVRDVYMDSQNRLQAVTLFGRRLLA